MKSTDDVAAQLGFNRQHTNARLQMNLGAPLRNVAPKASVIQLNSLVHKLGAGDEITQAEIAAIYGQANEKRHLATWMTAKLALSCVKSVELDLSHQKLQDEIHDACLTFGNVAFRMFGQVYIAHAANQFVMLVSERLGWADTDNFELANLMTTYLRGHPRMPEGPAGQAVVDRLIAGVSNAYLTME